MKLRVNGTGINYEVAGSGPALVLSHSLASNLHMWEPQMDGLTRSFTVIRFDTRGHGLSDAPNGPYSMVELAEDAGALMEELGVQAAHWLGLSLGGAIAQTFALNHPSQVLSLAIVDATSAYPPATHAMWQERIEHVKLDGMAGVADGTLGRWFTEGYRNAHPDRMVAIREMILATPPAGFIGSVQAIMGFDVSQRLHEIHCPTLVMCGEQDQALPPSHSRAIHDGIAGSVLKLIPDAAHISNIEQAEAFNAALLDFLQPQLMRVSK
jgi:3-oxoadipate enol-lactonase